MSAPAATSTVPPTNPTAPLHAQDNHRKIIIMHPPTQTVYGPTSSATHAVQPSQPQQQLLQQLHQPTTSRRNVICSPILPPDTNTSSLLPAAPAQIQQQAHITQEVEEAVLSLPPTPVARKITFDSNCAQTLPTRANITAAAPPPPAPCEPHTEVSNSPHLKVHYFLYNNWL